jgi:hypothetical protein
MSRIERAVLRYIDDAPPGEIWLGYIADAVFGDSVPTPAQRASLRRAVRDLAAAGCIEAASRGFNGHHERQYYVAAKALPRERRRRMVVR